MWCNREAITTRVLYAEQYEEAARQFRDDVAVNPADTEEAIWAFLAEAKLLGAERARQQFLQVFVAPALCASCCGIGTRMHRSVLRCGEQPGMGPLHNALTKPEPCRM